jgi:hypothetical protein
MTHAGRITPAARALLIPKAFRRRTLSTDRSGPHEAAMSDAYELVKLGTDSSGRTILMNRRMKAAYDVVCDRLGFEPTITQGAYMAKVGGGAELSAGYHDAGGCIDTRTWDIDSDDERRVIRVGRETGWAVWRRDLAHGGFEEEHMHWVLLGDKEAASGASLQMDQYRNNGDGMGGSDYHWRPAPIPTFDYEAYLEDDMPSVHDLLSAKLNPSEQKSETVRTALNKGADALAEVRGLSSAFGDFREHLLRRDRALADAIDAIAVDLKDTATKKQLARVRQALAADDG